MPKSDLASAERALEPLAQEIGAAGLAHDPEIAKISLVGAGMKTHPGVAADMFDALAEAGINILEARCTVSHPMVKNRFVVEVPDTAALKNCVTRLRNVDSVFDAYRVTPGG